LEILGRPARSSGGHSVGEIAAACIAGIFSIEEASRIIVLRAAHERLRPR